MEGLLGAASGIAVGGYLFAVVYQGNVKELGSMLKNEQGYLEFIAALAILGLLNKYGPGGKVQAALTTGAIITMLVKAGYNSGLNENLALFASGQRSALDTVKAILEGN